MGDIHCFLLKHERNRAWVIYSVVYLNRIEIQRGDIQCCVLKQKRNGTWGLYSVVY